MVKLIDLLKLLLEGEESIATQKAHKKGLKSAGYGKWANNGGKITHRTDPKTGDLVPVNGEQSGNPAQNMAKPTHTPADKAGVQPDNMPTPADAQKIAKNPAAPKPVKAAAPGPEQGMEGGPESGQPSPMDAVTVNPAYQGMKIEFGRPVDYQELKKKYPNDHFGLTDPGVIGETVLDVSVDEMAQFMDEFEPHGRTEEDSMAQQQNARAQAQQRLEQLSKQEYTALMRAQLWWQESAQFARDQEARVRNNKIINTLCDKLRPTIKTNRPIERGMKLSLDDAKQFLKKFHIGEEITDFPPSGFTTKPGEARAYSKPYSGTVYNGAEASPDIGIIMRIAPNKKGEIHGLQLNGINPPKFLPSDVEMDFILTAKAFESEEEVIRYSGPKVRTTNVTKLVSQATYGGVITSYIIDMEELGYDELQTEAIQPATDNLVFQRVMNTPLQQAQLTTETLSLTALLQEWDDDSPAANQAHALGLIHKGHGWWMDKSGKVVARTINGQLVKVIGDEPPVKPTFKTIPAATDKPKGLPKAATNEPPHKQKGQSSPQTNFMSKWSGFFGGGGKEPPTSKWTGGGGGGSGSWDDKKHHGKPVYKSPNELSWTVDEFPADLTELNGVPLTPWKNAPKTMQEWQQVEGQNPKMNEPPLPEPKYKSDKFGAGVIILEPKKQPDEDLKVWIIEPFNHFGGYEHTLPKGTQEEGLDLQQTAIKEAYEESGLKVQLLNHLGDFQRSTSIGRYYLAKRVGGTPLDHGWETHAVKLVSVNELPKYFNQRSDQRVARSLFKKLGIKWPPKEGELNADQIMAQQIGGQKGTNQGGFYKGVDGKLRYVKEPKNPAQAWVENLSSALYRELKIPAAPTQVFDKDKKMMLASEIVPGKQLGQIGLTSKIADKIVDGFGADVLLMNWDALGLADENIMVDKDDVYRIDPGGSLLFRAMGSPKTTVVPDESLDDASIEWNSLIQKGQYGKVFSLLGLKSADDLGQRIVKQLDAIKGLEKSYGGWGDFVDEHAQGMDDKSRERVIQMLNARSAWLYKKADEIWAKNNKNIPNDTKGGQGEFYYDPTQVNGMGKPKKIYGKKPEEPPPPDDKDFPIR